MGVFNPQNQILPSPIRSYYKGKAMRAQIAGSELQNEMNRDTLEHADDARALAERRVANAEASTDLQEGRDQQAAEKAGREQFADWGIGIYAEYESAATPEEGLAGFTEKMQKFYDSLPDDAPGKDKLGEMLEDGKLTHEEARGFYAEVLSIRDRVLSGGGDSPDPYAKLNPKDFTPESWAAGEAALARGEANWRDNLRTVPSGDKPDFEPPNLSEREHAENLIDKSSRLSDLSSNDEEIARDILASDIRQLQAAGFDLEEASFMAVAKLEKKVKDEPGKWWGTNQVLDLAELPEGQYKATDGYIYKDDGNGGFKRVD